VRVFKHYIPWNVFLLVTIEAFIIFWSVYFSQSIHFPRDFSLFSEIKSILPKSITIIFINVIILYIGNLYDIRLYKRKRELLARIIPCLFLIYSTIVMSMFIFPYMEISRKSYILYLIISLSSILLYRILYYWVLSIKKLQEKVLILGVNAISLRIARELKGGESPGFEVLGLVAEDTVSFLDEAQNHRILGTLKDLESITRVYRPDIVVVALSEQRGTFPSKEILRWKLQGIQVEDWPTFYEKLTGKIVVQNLRPSWLIFADGFTRNRLTKTIKSLVDTILAVLGVCLSLPLMVLIGLLTKLDSAGPVFFRQERVGENGRIFTLFKFRTMVADAEKDTGPVWAQNVDPRVTRLGRVLRRTGMDEIPQLLNVLKGDMSFVGPRPERPHFVAALQEKIPYYSQRLAVKPGITGWAQVRYGYGATIEDAVEKLQYDLYYIKNISIFLDLLIVLSTIHKVLFARVAVQSSPEEEPWFPLLQPGAQSHDLSNIPEASVSATVSHETENLLVRSSKLEEEP
jgi:sugar transferase (PEP-CTERM system associated)